MEESYVLFMVADDKLKSGKLMWRHITNPTQEKLEELQSEYGFHDLDLEDCLSKTESPKIEEYNKYVFVVFHFPVKRLKTNHITIESLNVFIGQNYLITISNGKLKKLEDFWERLNEQGRKRSSSFKQGSGYLLYLMMDELFEIYTPYISQVSRAIREIEDDIFEGKVMKDRLYDIMGVKRQIIALKRALRPHSDLIVTIEHLHKRFITKKLELYFDDIADKINRDVGTLVAMNEMSDTLHNANESLTSHNTNRVMKVLTIFSVTMLPLTFLTGLYGMNVALPLAKDPEAFKLLVGGMIGVFLFAMFIFKWKRYL